MSRSTKIERANEHKDYQCSRCGEKNPRHFFTNEKNDIVACESCPDVHVFDAFQCCTCCGQSLRDPEVTPFCKRRAH